MSDAQPQRVSAGTTRRYIDRFRCSLIIAGESVAACGGERQHLDVTALTELAGFEGRECRRARARAVVAATRWDLPRALERRADG